MAQRSLSEDLQRFAAFVREYVRTHQRPWGNFVEEFSKPNRATWEGRVYRNLIHYRVNYAMIATAFILTACYFRPMLVLILSLLAAAWTYLFRVRTAPIIVGGRMLTRQHKAIVVGACTTVLLLATGTVLAFVTVSSLLTAAIVGHATLRVNRKDFGDHDDDFDELEQATRPMDARRVQAQESYRKRREQMQQYPSVPVMMNPAKPATASHSFTQSKSE